MDGNKVFETSGSPSFVELSSWPGGPLASIGHHSVLCYGKTVEEVIDGIIQDQRRKMERGRRLLKKEIPPSQSLDLLPEERYLRRDGLKWRLR